MSSTGPSAHLELVHPPDWPKPRGYVNGIVARGRTLHIAGQIGWTPAGHLASVEFVGQFAQALDNVLAVVQAAGGTAGDVVRMTVYVTDLAAYRNAVHALGPIWRARLGKHYPAMALLGVAGLVEPGALVEIEAVAVLGD